MGKLKLLLIAAVTMALTIGLAGMASAATISCGQCHGTKDNSVDGTGAAVVTDRRGVTEPGYEGSTIPTQDNGSRGLHGVHMNYSSATYGANGTQTIAGVPGVFSKRGNCNYCHNGHPRHATGFVNFTATGAITTVATQPLVGNKYLMVYTSAGRGVSYKNNIPSFDMNPTGNCTTACHKLTTAANPAPWGNYTSASIHLTCNSCHGDASNYGPSASNSGLGNGSTGTAGHKVHLYSVGGSHGNQLLGGTKIVLGTFSTVIDMNGNTNKVCAACHPDNTNDLWSQGKSDDGTKKAYPHAVDGTNVQAKNANFTAPAGIVFTNASGLLDTTGKLSCTNNCHFNKSSVQTTDPKWNSTSGCELCHNHTPSAGVNISATRPLTYAHALHFQAISTMEIGSGTVSRTDLTPTGNASCSDCHTEAHTVNALGGPQLIQLPVKDGAAGLEAEMNYSASGTISVSGTCTNRCHTSGSPAWNLIATNSLVSVNGCGSCHAYPGASNDWTGANGHTIRYTPGTVGTYNSNINVTHLNVATAYNKLTDTYSAVTGDATLCGKCHSGGTHMNGVKNVNAGTGNAAGFSLHTSTAGSQRVAQCSNAKCHFNRTTPNWY